LQESEEATERADATARQLEEQAVAMKALEQELERVRQEAEEKAQQLNETNGRLLEVRVVK
jgi:hypothetical protein